MDMYNDEVESFRQCWLALIPDALPRWWARVRNVQANRARLGAEWLTLDSRWAAYDRARDRVTSPLDDDAVRSFISGYQPSRDRLAAALLGDCGEVGEVSLLVGEGRLVEALAEIYQGAVGQQLGLSGLPEWAADLGADAYVGPLLDHFRTAAERHRRDVARRIGPDAMCRRWVQGVRQPTLVLKLLRADFGLSLADAVEVYRRTRPATDAKSRP